MNQTSSVWLLALAASSARGRTSRLTDRDSSVCRWSRHPLFDRQLVGEIEWYAVEPKTLALGTEGCVAACVDIQLRQLVTINSKRSHLVSYDLDTGTQRFSVPLLQGARGVAQMCVDSASGLVYLMSPSAGVILVHSTQTGSLQRHLSDLRDMWDMTYVPPPSCRLVVLSNDWTLRVFRSDGVLEAYTQLTLMHRMSSPLPLPKIHCMAWDARQQRLVIAHAAGFCWISLTGQVLANHGRKHMPTERISYLTIHPTSGEHYVGLEHQLLRVAGTFPCGQAVAFDYFIRYWTSPVSVCRTRRRHWLVTSNAYKGQAFMIPLPR